MMHPIAYFQKNVFFVFLNIYKGGVFKHLNEN
jgi:hypothetical protein